MNASFQRKRIGDVCSVGDGAHSKVDRLSEGIPYLTSKNIGQGNLKLDQFDCISEEAFEKLFPANSKATRRPQAGDVLFGIIGTFGNAYLYKETDKFCFASSIGILRPNPADLHPKFLYYVLSSQAFKENHANHNAGSVQGYTNIATVKSLEIPVPPLADQRSIARILASLDDKIELNRKTNQTLEQIAQTIFKSWFVDFEPTRAKIAAKENGASFDEIERAAMCAISGKKPAQLAKLPPATQQQLKTTAALFPNALVDSELGEIPEGWGVSEIGKEVDVVGGGTPSTANTEFWEDGQHHWTTPKDMSNLTDKILLETDRKITDAGLSKISSGLLPKNTVLMSSRAPVGYLAIAKIPVAINQGYIAMKCEKLLSPEYIVQWAVSVMDEIKQRSSGTTFAEISKTNFRLIRVLVPNEKLVRAYTQEASSIYEKITSLLLENRELISIRDSLLPKLLSGEIEVSNVD